MSITALQKTTDARELVDKLMEVIGYDRRAWWIESELWYKLKKNNLYKNYQGEHHDDNYKSWRTFIGSMNFPVTTIDYKVRVYDKYIIELKYNPTDLLEVHTRYLDLAVPYINAENKEDVISMAQTLSFSDFNKELREL